MLLPAGMYREAFATVMVHASWVFLLGGVFRYFQVRS